MISPAELLATLAKPERLRLLALLRRGEACVCELTAALQLPQYQVSRDLRALRQAGLLDERPDGKWAYYRLAERLPAPVRQLVDAVLALHDARPDAARLCRALCCRQEGRCCVRVDLIPLPRLTRA